MLELLPKYRALCQTLAGRDEGFDIEAGSLIWHEGRLLRTLGSNGERVSAIDATMPPPYQPEDIITIENANDVEHCVYMPSIRELLDCLREQTGHFPALTPGVQTTREVWQAKHPDCEPVVASSLEEALVDLALQLLAAEHEGAVES